MLSITYIFGRHVGSNCGINHMQGSKSNTIWNNDLFYMDRIKSENARVGIATSRAANPWDFNMVKL